MPIISLFSILLSFPYFLLIACHKQSRRLYVLFSIPVITLPFCVLFAREEANKGKWLEAKSAQIKREKSLEK
jgi:uncharacterized membrane protein